MDNAKKIMELIENKKNQLGRMNEAAKGAFHVSICVDLEFEHRVYVDLLAKIKRDIFNNASKTERINH